MNEDELLSYLGFKRDEIPRFRFVYLDDKPFDLDWIEDDDLIEELVKLLPLICLETRTGGNNGEGYALENAKLFKHESFICAFDLRDDNTYLRVFYKYKEEAEAK